MKTMTIATSAWMAAVSTLAPLMASSADRIKVADHELVPYEIVDGTSIPRPLTDTPGDPAKGREAVVLRSAGNCLACHRAPIPEEPDHGEIGTDLAGAGTRWSEGELRLRLVNPKLLNPETVMPAFYRIDGLHRVAKAFAGRPILTAQQIEDVVSYLKTLK